MGSVTWKEITNFVGTLAVDLLCLVAGAAFTAGKVLEWLQKQLQKIPLRDGVVYLKERSHFARLPEIKINRKEK